MPMPWVFRGLRNGVVTTRYPRADDAYLRGSVSGVEVIEAGSAETGLVLPDADRLRDLCPTGALGVGPDGRARVDLGACIGCGRCVADLPETFRWRRGAEVASLERSALVVGPAEGSDEEIAQVRRELAARVRALRRSVHLRHVDVGSDGSEEWEIQALLNPVYDIGRLGIFFTASPRHADVLLVTGIGAPGMVAPLRRTREAMPDPVVVIAVGTDAVSGGIFGGGYGSSGGVGDLLDVDVWVPGSPASPFSILHAILLALGRMPEGVRR